VHAEEFAPRDVELGLASGDQVEVLSGVEAGERIVVSGTSQVRAALLAGP
jgi:multidrug efflux pump subunit AcrA (membrane-fusion protein)